MDKLAVYVCTKDDSVEIMQRQRGEYAELEPWGGNFYTLADSDAATVSIYAATPVNVHTCGSHHPFPSVATYNLKFNQPLKNLKRKKSKFRKKDFLPDNSLFSVWL